MGDEGARFQGCDRGGHGLPAAACAAACRTVGERTEGSSASFMERPSAKLVPYAMQHPRNNTRGNQYSPDVNSFGASSSTIVQTGPEDPSTHTTSCLMAGGAIPLASSSVCTCMRVRSGARARGHALDPTRGPVADAPRRTSHPRGAGSTAKVSAGGSVARTTSPAASATPCAGMMGCACPMLLTGLFLNFRRFFGGAAAQAEDTQRLNDTVGRRLRRPLCGMPPVVAAHRCGCAVIWCAAARGRDSDARGLGRRCRSRLVCYAPPESWRAHPGRGPHRGGQPRRTRAARTGICFAAQRPTSAVAVSAAA